MKLFVGALVFVSMLSVCSVSPSSRPPDECSDMSTRLRTFRLTMICNTTTLKEKQLKEIQAPTTNLYLPVLYLVAFIVGLPSNLLALWILVFRTKPVPSITLLINLTVVDCLLLLMLPFRIIYHFRGNHWELGEPFCRVVMAMFYGNMYGSVWCLAFVALDRYVALVHPFRARTLRSMRVSLYMAVVVWVVVLFAMVPVLISQQTYFLHKLNITTCHDALPEDEHETYFLPYFTTLFASCFLLPLTIVVFCHTAVLRTLLAERKRYGQAIMVTVLVLLVFIVCLLPSNILLLLTYTDSWADGDEFRQRAKTALCCRDNCKVKPTKCKNSMSSSSGPKTQVTLLSISSRREMSQTVLTHQQDKVTVT
ncbi:proteinase-activated receptor 4 isoform X2 [Melanotaenia boesemani]|uniref:proteinase-activated receptor 4 isoform X2 n=1 Tax=Melanotaenia boesemani TaxID=1250792 RepID=UPI001C055DB8|nr:proteinase-activated receptor 4 isoform X2 [Melanotaenia boesemani]